MQLPGEDQEAQAQREKEQRDREQYIKEAEEMFGRGSSANDLGGSVLNTRGTSIGV